MSKQTFDFSEALRRMKEGKKVRRIGWGSYFSKLLELFHLRRYSRK